MKLVYGNLWDYPADARVVTTNGFVKADGRAVMGRGCAKEASMRYPDLSKQLGSKIINAFGKQQVWPFVFNNDLIFNFPVKTVWYEKADLDLIAKSALELVDEVDHGQFKIKPNGVIVIPRPGCGNGGLKWRQVSPILIELFDDRFHIIDFRPA